MGITKQKRDVVIVRGHFAKRGQKRVYVYGYIKSNVSTARKVAKKLTGKGRKAQTRVQRNRANYQKPWGKFEKRLLGVFALICLFGAIFNIGAKGETQDIVAPGGFETAQVVEIEHQEPVEMTEIIEDGKGQTVVTPEESPEEERAAIAAMIHPNCHQYIPVVQQYSWDTRTAVAVMVGEVNGCNPEAANRAASEDHTKWCGRFGSMGLFQLATCWADYFGIAEGDLFDAERNIELAYYVYNYSGGSFRLWGAYTNGSYQRWLAAK